MNQSLSPEALQAIGTMQQSPSRPAGLRRMLFAALAGGIAIAGAGYGAWQLVVASHHATTDNAYVEADTAQVTALTSGPVAEVRVVDTQEVRKGDVLVVLDDADRRLELRQAEAALDQAERRVRGYIANDTNLSGSVAARRADLIRARADLERARLEYARRRPLRASGAVSGEELSTYATALATAEAASAQAEGNLRAAEGAQAANEALIAGVAVDQNPEVAAARSRAAQARVALSRTIVRAPVSGVVVKRSVEVGQMVQAGTPLMTLVPVQQAYVNANFKEGQLRNVRVGQAATLWSDLYGSKTVFHGRVVGFSGGTGASLSLVPAQNATGNWIKVVQRLPVRIVLDPAELTAHPLKVGLSMNVDIDTQH